MAFRRFYNDAGRQTINAQYPLTKIEIERDIVKIYLAPTAELGHVVNLGQFKGAKPGMTDTELSNLFGEASR